MLEFIKKNLKVILVLSLIPIIFIGILEYFSEEITADGWLGFLGGYFGVLGAVGAIWYQKSLDNEAAINGIELYTNYIVENLSKKLEEHYLPFLTVFATLDGYDETYEIEEITKRKKDFNIINADIITSNLSIILSNKKFVTLLSLKEKLENLNYYISELENDITKGDIFIPLLNDLDNFLKNTKNNISISEYFFKIIKELNFLRAILLKLNMSYHTKSIAFKENEILPEYEFLIQDIIKAFNNKNKVNLDILKCYKTCIGNIGRIIILINQKIKVRKYYYYPYNLLNLINIMISIYEDIDKLKSTKK